MFNNVSLRVTRLVILTLCWSMLVSLIDAGFSEQAFAPTFMARSMMLLVVLIVIEPFRRVPGSRR